jgi:uncharacterized protein YbgA (DUF1722 family)/uncharacterized protein YbbK (DUF523 family)
MEKPVVIISACLLGQNVRHDGGNLNHKWLVEELSHHVTWRAICPELAMGLSSPREAMRLVYDGDAVESRLITSKTGEDLTELAREASKKLLVDWDDVCGVILAKKSPTCGVDPVKVYNLSTSIPDRKSAGIFAGEVALKFPHIPMIDSGRMHDFGERERFVKTVMTYARFKKMGKSTRELQRFHQQHKYMLMEHSHAHVSLLGKIAANSDKKSFDQQYLLYLEMLSLVLKINPTIKTRKNVLLHLFGYFKTKISSEEKKHFLESIEEYSSGLTPYITMVKMIEMFLNKYKNSYLDDQLYLSPYPKGLALRRGIL